MGRKPRNSTARAGAWLKAIFSVGAGIAISVLLAPGAIVGGVTGAGGMVGVLVVLVAPTIIAAIVATVGWAHDRAETAYHPLTILIPGVGVSVAWMLVIGWGFGTSVILDLPAYVSAVIMLPAVVAIWMTVASYRRCRMSREGDPRD